MAYDPVRQRLVLHGGITIAPERPVADTWEWDGTTWKLCPSAHVPTWNGSCAMVYDAARSRITLVSLGAATTGMAVWTWDGVDWTSRTPVHGPSLRVGFSLSYDPVRQRVLLFGGSTGLQVLGDTWEWDGATWTQRTPALSPPARSHYAMAYSPTRDRTLLTGGIDPSGTRSDTWEWDGNTWTQLSPTTAAPALFGARMEYLPSVDRIVLFGGRSSPPAVDLAETWIWDGSKWNLANPPVRPDARTLHSLTYDPRTGMLVTFGGQRNRESLLYGFDGATWNGIASPGSPPQGTSVLAAFDESRARTVLYAPATGISYELEGEQSWAFPPVGATPSSARALVYDRIRRRLLLLANGALGYLDTWERRGTKWARIPTVTNPLVGTGSVVTLAFDSGRDRAVLYSGQGAPGQTWEFDGTDWRRIVTASAPAELVHAITYDRARKLTFALAGYVRYQRGTAKVWTFDGANWVQHFPASAPPAREWTAATYDPVRQRVVIYGGVAVESQTGPSLDLNDLHEWDGTAWRESPGSRGAPARNGHQLVYDTARSCLVMLGGNGGTRVLDPWEYGPVRAARSVSYGSGCAGTLGVPDLRPREDMLPWLGEPFTFELDRVGRAGSALPPLLLVGDSRSTWSGFTLPLDFGPYGMPGCALLSAVTLSAPMTVHPGFARHELLVPSTPILIGQKFYAQGLAPDPGANPAGFVTSNGCELTLGAK